MRWGGHRLSRLRRLPIFGCLKARLQLACAVARVIRQSSAQHKSMWRARTWSPHQTPADHVCGLARARKFRSCAGARRALALLELGDPLLRRLQCRHEGLGRDLLLVAAAMRAER